MDIQNMKNMVILKNLPSNLVEEAFIVLKDNVNVHKEQLANSKISINNKKNMQSKDYVIKEAEMIIKEYVSKVENKKNKTTKEKTELQEKCKKLKYSTIFFAMFSILSIISLILK